MRGVVGHLGLVERTEDPRRGVDLVLARVGRPGLAHAVASVTPARWARIFSMPSRIRPFTVPIGVSSMSAISDWLKPP